LQDRRHYKARVIAGHGLQLGVLLRKPWWVRAVGLLGWGCAALWFGVVFMKPIPQTTMGRVVIFDILPLLVLGLWLLWGVMSFVLYVVGRAAKQNAAILRDALAATGKPFPVGPTPAGSRVSKALDQISLNVPRRHVAPTRQTGSIFGLTLGQQPRATHPPEATAGGTQPAAGVPPGPAGPAGKETEGKGEPSVYTYEAPGLPSCPVCGVRPVIFYCTRHSQALCLECVVRHDRALECVYVPGWRGGKSEAH
jgi:hypothetical protein